MPLRAGENRGGLLSECLPKPATLCKPIMHERPCFETPTEVHCREAQRSKVYSYGWCCLKAFRVVVQKARELWQQLVLHTLLHPAALLHEKLPLVSFLALGPPLKNTLIREVSIEARFCIVHADSGFQLVLCSMFIQQAMARRAFTSAVKSAHCLFTGLKAGESNGGVWRFDTSELWQGTLDFGRSLNATARSDVSLIQ